MYVAKVEITNRRSCCLKTDTSFKVLLGNSSSTHCTKYYNVYRRKSIVFVCSHPVKTTDVTLQIIGADRILTLCEVTVIAFGKSVKLLTPLHALFSAFTSTKLLLPVRPRARGMTSSSSDPVEFQSLSSFKLLFLQ